MNTIYDQYNNIKKQREKVVGRLQTLERKRDVVEYNNLKAENKELISKQRRIEDILELKKYEECDHILITYYNDWECNYCGCMKCGLHYDIMYPHDKNMYYYFNNSNNLKKYWNSKKLDITCDLELATAVCRKIMETHPNIDDETLIKYFENAIDHIHNKEVSEERQINRAKRLELKSNFFNFKN